MAKLPAALKRNLAAKLLSGACAVALWAYVASESSGRLAVEASIRHVNVPEGMEIDPDQAGSVTVLLQGPRSRLDRLRVSGLSFEVDYSDYYEPTPRTFSVTAKSLRLPAEVELVKAVPSQLRLGLDESAGREVEVEARFLGAHRPDYEIVDYRIEPKTLRIVGPSRRVALVVSVETDPIDLRRQVGRRSYQAHVFLADPYVRFAETPIVTVDVQMHKRARD